jgi:multidrug resistance efflux pump
MLKISRYNIYKNIEPERLYALRSLRGPSGARLLARLMLVLLGLFITVMFLPWQQNIRGSGLVTALDPANRPQRVEAVIAGRVQRWHIREGDFVRAGDTIVTLSEVKEKYFDPALLDRMAQQMSAKESSIKSKNLKAEALLRQIKALREAKDIKISQSRAKMDADRIRYENAENQYTRNKSLFDAGNIPLTKLQDFEYKYRGAEADYQNSRLELTRVEVEYLDKINKAESELNNTYSDIFDSQGDLAKYRNEYTNTTIRQAQYQVITSQSGYVVKAMKAGLGETIQEGDAICTIMPTTDQLAVEMYVRAMDVPLISIGRQVRIQFDGWPAVQFSGWPSVSVGTFGGRVKVIDYVSSKPGEFRILLVPDTADGEWPSELRVGSGTKGWVMLDNVPVWYELWRQLNGFPPSLYEKPQIETATNSDSKKPKSK